MDMNMSNSGRQWTTEEIGVLQSMGSKESDLATEEQQQWSKEYFSSSCSFSVCLISKLQFIEHLNL